MSQNMPVLEVEDVEKLYRIRRAGRVIREVPALSGVSFGVPRGKVLGVVGESGSGKSTLTRMLLALEAPTEGSVRFEGRDLAQFGKEDLRAFRRRVQVVFQDPTSSLDPRMTAGQSLLEPLRSLGVEGDLDAIAEDALRSVGLPEGSRDRLPRTFSGGQRQRIAIARALAPQPQVLIADEPVSALDVSVQAQVLNLLMKLKAERDLTLIMVSHDLAVVYHVADDVIVMKDGEIVEQGPVEAVFRSPQHPYTQSLLDSILTLG
ncbi:MAG: ATP-binding cassette domain-containing protein [Acidimicrobiia bacterium]